VCSHTDWERDVAPSTKIFETNSDLFREKHSGLGEFINPKTNLAADSEVCERRIGVILVQCRNKHGDSQKNDHQNEPAYAGMIVKGEPDMCCLSIKHVLQAEKPDVHSSEVNAAAPLWRGLVIHGISKTIAPCLNGSGSRGELDACLRYILTTRSTPLRAMNQLEDQIRCARLSRGRYVVRG
jgi:hypothetical protein